MIALDLSRLLGFRIVAATGAAALRSPKIGVKDARQSENITSTSR